MMLKTYRYNVEYITISHFFPLFINFRLKVFKNGVEKLFEYEFREFGNFPTLHTSHLGIEKEF